MSSWCGQLAAAFRKGCLVTGVFAMVIASNVGLAATTDKAKTQGVQKIKAPSAQAHSDYYAPNRKQVSAADLKKADELRVKTIVSIRQLLKGKEEKSGRHFELLLRLGELHTERHDYLRDLEQQAWDKRYQEWQASPKDKRGPEPKLSNTASLVEIRKATDAFRQLVTRYPKHPRTDAALYSLAKSLATTGNDNAIEFYKLVIKNHPKSKLLPDVYLAMGEFWFDKHKIPDAIESYKQVLAFKEHRAYPYAVYKLGWSYYNNKAKNEAEEAENFKKSVASFKLVVKLADEQKSQKISSNFNLREEAIKDLIMVWAETEDTDSAWTYFRSIGEESSFYTMLERLGWLYAEQGQNQKAAKVYQRLVTEAPLRKNNPRIYLQLVEMVEQQENPQATVNALLEMQKLYVGETAWTKANRQGNPDIVAEAEGAVEKAMHRYGAMFHARGQKANLKNYLMAAGAIYAAYLQSFHERDAAYEVRFYLAEIQYDFGKLESAADHYWVVAKQKPKDPKKEAKFARDAALNAVSAMSKLVADTKFEKTPAAGKVQSPLEIPRLKKKTADLMDQFVAMRPSDLEGDAMRFSTAQTYFDYGHYDESLQRFSELASSRPGTKQGLAAAKIVLAYHAGKEQWALVATESRKYLKSKLLTDQPGMKKFLDETLHHASFKQALVLEESKKYQEAATAFLAYQQEFPTDSHADRALHNAAVNFYRVSRVEDAMAANKQLLSSYPKSNLRPLALLALAETYEALAQFESAAKYYKTFADAYSSDKRAPGALYNAAVLFKGVGNLDLSSQLLQEFVRRNPQHEITSDAQLELARQREKQGKFSEAVQVYDSLAKVANNSQGGAKDRELFAAAKSAELRSLHLDVKSGSQDLEKIRKVLSTKGAPPAYDARQVVASALFRQTEGPFAAFKSVNFNAAGIEKQIQRKQALLETVAGSYERIIGVGSAEYTVAALYRLGEMHEQFAESLLRAPPPSGATQADIDKIRTQLERLAFPLRDESQKFFDLAHRRSSEVETFSVWTRRSYQKMVEIQPAKYPDVQELSADPSYLSHRVSVNDATNALAE